jgi:hypothetical protein
MRKLIVLWGLCDALAFAVYLFGKFSTRQVPILSEVSSFLDHLNNDASSVFVAFVFLLIPIARFSLAFSSYFLLRNKKVGAVIYYVQLPFRILAGPPSLYIVWFPIITLYPQLPRFGMALTLTMVIIEIIKLVSIVKWQRELKVSERE